MRRYPNYSDFSDWQRMRMLALKYWGSSVGVDKFWIRNPAAGSAEESKYKFIY